MTNPDCGLRMGTALLALVASVTLAAAQSSPALPFPAFAVSAGAEPAAAPLSVVGLVTANGLLPSNNPPLQTLLGAATLSLMGQAPAAPLSDAGLLKAGDHLGCWLLIVEDPFSHIRDRLTPLPNPKTRPDEYKAIAQILLQTTRDNPVDFHNSAVANRGVTYAMLFKRPDVHRGKAIHIEGDARWIRKLDTPPLLKNAGLDLYEVWIVNYLFGDAPYSVLVTRLPAGLPQDKRINVRVALDGYFLKRRLEKKEAVPFKSWTQSLLLAARTLTVATIPPTVTAHGRIITGSATLVMSGAGPAGTTALAELALLRAGEHAACWKLVNSDVVRPIRKETLAKIKDGKTLPDDALGGTEFDALLEVLIQTWHTSPGAFEKAARKDLSFSLLFHEPANYRGEVVHIEGRLRWCSAGSAAHGTRRRCAAHVRSGDLRRRFRRQSVHRVHHGTARRRAAQPESERKGRV